MVGVQSQKRKVNLACEEEGGGKEWKLKTERTERGAGRGGAGLFNMHRQAQVASTVGFRSWAFHSHASPCSTRAEKTPS